MKGILLAGSTSYLGSYIAKELQKRSCFFRVIARTPEKLKQNDIALIAFDILGSKPKITHIPDWVRVTILKLARLFTGSRVYGPVEFFMTVMSMNMLAPEYGKHTLKEYLTNLNNPNS